MSNNSHKRTWIVLAAAIWMFASASLVAALPGPVPVTETGRLPETSLSQKKTKTSFPEKLLHRWVKKKWRQAQQKIIASGFAGGAAAPEEGAAMNAVSMGLGIASIPLVLIGFSTVGTWAVILVAAGIAAAACALAFGITGVRNNYRNKGMGIAGIVTGGITLGGLAVLALLVLIVLFAFL